MERKSDWKEEKKQSAKVKVNINLVKWRLKGKRKKKKRNVDVICSFEKSPLLCRIDNICIRILFGQKMQMVIEKEKKKIKVSGRRFNKKKKTWEKEKHPALLGGL